MAETHSSPVAMLVDCPGCARSYHVSSADLGERGRTLVCPRCDAQWHQGVSNHDLAVAVVSARPESHLDETQVAPRRFVVPRKTPAFAGAALACLGFASLVLARDHVVRALPRTAALYAAAGLPVNVVGLVFRRIAPERLASSDVTIHGTLRNVAGRRIRVPRLAFEVRDAAGMTLVAWNETVPAKTLAAGGEIGFASTPHRLPSDSRTVLVHFD